MKTLCALAVGVRSCLFSLRLAELNLPPLTGKMR